MKCLIRGIPLVLYLYCFFLFSCSPDSKETPLPKKTMQTFALDAALIEAARLHLKSIDSLRDSIDIKVRHSYLQLYKKLSTTPDKVRESHDYYTQHPEEYEDVLKVVLDSLKSLKSQYSPENVKG